MWLIFALITAFCWGLSTTFIKKSYESFSPIIAVILGGFAGIIILLPFALINGAKLVFWPLVPVATLAAASYIFYFYALERGKLALTGTVLTIYPLFTIILAALFLSEVTTTIAKIGIVTILFGLIFLSLEKFSGLKNIKLGAWLWWGLTGAALSGLGDFLAKAMVSNFDAYSYSLAFVIGWLITAFVMFMFDKRRTLPKSFNQNAIFLILAEVLLFLGYMFLYLALKDGLASIVVPISASYSVLSLFLALVWLKEKISKPQILGAVLTIIGVIIVSTK